MLKRLSIKILTIFPYFAFLKKTILSWNQSFPANLHEGLRVIHLYSPERERRDTVGTSCKVNPWAPGHTRVSAGTTRMEESGVKLPKKVCTCSKKRETLRGSEAVLPTTSTKTLVFAAPPSMWFPRWRIFNSVLPWNSLNTNLSALWTHLSPTCVYTRCRQSPPTPDPLPPQPPHLLQLTASLLPDPSSLNRNYSSLQKRNLIPLLSKSPDPFMTMCRLWVLALGV